MKNRTKLNLVSLGGLIVFLALAFGSTNKNQSASSTGGEKGSATPTASPVSVSASALFNAYESNEIAADETYKGKIILVTGTIDSVGKDITDSMYVSLKTSNSIFGIQCFFDDANKGALSRLNKGQTVTIRGRCDGKFGNILLKDCIIQ
jgi:hypothetical protein